MNNKVIDFTYTKDSGDVSNRKIVTIYEPTHLLTGLDITNSCLTDFDVKLILMELEEASQAHNARIYSLIEEFGGCALKSFKEKGITNKKDVTNTYKTKGNK